MASDYITRTVTDGGYYLDVRFVFSETRPHGTWNGAEDYSEGYWSYWQEDHYTINGYSYSAWINSGNVAVVTMTHPDSRSQALEGQEATRRLLRDYNANSTEEEATGTISFAALLTGYQQQGYLCRSVWARFFNSVGPGSGIVTFRVYKYSNAEVSTSSTYTDEETGCELVEGDRKYYRYHRGAVTYRIRHHIWRTTTTTTTTRYFYRQTPGGAKTYIGDPVVEVTQTVEDVGTEQSYTRQKTGDEASWTVECGCVLRFLDCGFTCHPGNADISGTAHTVEAFWGSNRVPVACFCDDGCTVTLAGAMTIPADATPGKIYNFVWQNSSGQRAGYTIKKI